MFCFKKKTALCRGYNYTYKTALCRECNYTLMYISPALESLAEVDVHQHAAIVFLLCTINFKLYSRSIRYTYCMKSLKTV